MPAKSKTGDIADIPPEADHRDFVKALATGLDIIRAFDHDHPRMTLSELATLRGINRAKARRFLITLHALGYVRKQDRYFELTPRALDLGYAYLSANGYQQAIQQHLEHVTEVTGESSSMGVLDGADIIYVARSASRHRLMAMTLGIGTRLPAIVTSMGRMLLAMEPARIEPILAQGKLTAYTSHTMTDPDELRASLDEIRERGYCIVDQELETGLRSLAVPVNNRHGKLIAALNISTNAARVPRRRLEENLLPLLLETSRRVGATVD